MMRPASGLVSLAEQEAIARRCASVVRQCLRADQHRMADIDPSTDFHTDLKADSLDMISITMAIEDEFGFEVPVSSAARCITFGDLTALVCRLSGVVAA